MEAIGSFMLDDKDDIVRFLTSDIHELISAFRNEHSVELEFKVKGVSVSQGHVSGNSYNRNNYVEMAFTMNTGGTPATRDLEDKWLSHLIKCARRLQDMLLDRVGYGIAFHFSIRQFTAFDFGAAQCKDT